MSKKLDILEHIKTGILVVLFLITILLLYLLANQSSKDFSVSEIISGGNGSGTSVDIENYLVPSYAVKSKGNGRYLITYKNQKEAFDRACDCAAVFFGSSNISITEITADEYETVAAGENAVQLVFAFDFPFDYYVKSLTGKSLNRPEGLTGFKTMLFSDSIKSDLYMRNTDGLCFKISVAENYYATEALDQVLSFDAGEIGFMDIYQLSFRSIKDIDFNFDEAPEKLFGDTLDFVRRITDGEGNETYMYGYGQKRLSVYAAGGLEYKEDVSAGGDSDFYEDLEAALLFMKEKFGVDESEMRLQSAEFVVDDAGACYVFNFEAGSYSIRMDVKSGTVSFLSIGQE